MHVNFVERDGSPDKLLCDAEIVFDANDGPLAGMKLVGFSVWRSAEGGETVTFPSRSFGAGGDRRYFDYLRSADGIPATAKRVKGWILDAFRAAQVEA
jgi:hypothetical protein